MYIWSNAENFGSVRPRFARKLAHIQTDRRTRRIHKRLFSDGKSAKNKKIRKKYYFSIYSKSIVRTNLVIALIYILQFIIGQRRLSVLPSSECEFQHKCIELFQRSIEWLKFGSVSCSSLQNNWQHLCQSENSRGGNFLFLPHAGNAYGPSYIRICTILRLKTFILKIYSHT